jgi:hypothetical protein
MKSFSYFKNEEKFKALLTSLSILIFKEISLKKSKIEIKK